MTWLVEKGIGEDRALLLQNDQIIAARHRFEGAPRAGCIYPARLIARTAGSARGTALAEAGFEVLVDKLPRDCSEGRDLHVLLTRAPIAESGRFKRAQGRVAQESEGSGSIEAERQAAERQVTAFSEGLWEELWHAASSGRIAFPGGEIICGVTPGMTVIDVDGDLPPKALSLAAIPAIAQAIRWFGMGGNIGLDFPTLPGKSDRAAIDRALDDALIGWAHERTAMNGFGFVQLVARLEGPSLLHSFATARIGLCARYALRMAEHVKGHERVLLLTVHPALRARLKPAWLEDVSRRTGKQIRVETDPALALESPAAQCVAS